MIAGIEPLPAILTDLPQLELGLARQLTARGTNAPLTSSCGRLFDGVTALLGLRRQVRCEGQAALNLK